jgi:WD40 repeat protein
MTERPVPHDGADGIRETVSNFWAKAESISKVLSAIAIPIVIAVGGWWIQNSITKQSISKDYVTLAIGILEKSKSEIDQSLRDWAVDLLAEYAPSKFPAETISRLRAGSISLGARKASGRVAITPDGQSVAVGGRDGGIRIVDLRTGKTLKRLLGHTAAITALAFTPDGRQLFSGSLDHHAREWDVAQGSSGAIMPFPNAVLDLYVSPDGSRLIVGLEEETLLVLDQRTHQELERHKLP